MKFKPLLALPFLFPLVTPQSIATQTISPIPSDTVTSFISDKPSSSFPNMEANFNKTVVEPREAALKAEQDKEAAAAVKPARVTVSYQIQTFNYSVWGSLTGSYGYALAGGNCVDQIPYSIRGEGNPISWPVTTMTPYIGGAALWAGINHVARITGFWSNGDIEVAQENWSGAPVTRFSRSTFRGYR